ncbi:hypothetical protein SLEP1_g21649 [Rubroshorea leprosula]|uniref:BHLH domain-containing protein n=1 Tax=Rubroshorea leprosula TaxID=152421 RepID=A0AAV5JH66_9ROSI|nr:hypothetical protein SLEP1_g21649 [Rubroshorea leprosula]
MADLYGTAPPSNAEPEEISTFLNRFLQNSASSSSYMHLRNRYIQPPSSAALDSLQASIDCGSVVVVPGENRYRLGGSASGLEMEARLRDGGSGLNFSDPESYFRANDSAENAFCSLGDLSCEGEAPERSVLPSNAERPRSSSKRSRAAEVHNLSEKRRRSRINEKMKALQKLIPNSNKTDKASMLDEAIEYLKQLQLQVQMLSMRNGLSLYPMCLPGVLQPTQLLPTGLVYEQGNAVFSHNAGTIGTFSSSTSAPFNVSNQATISNQPIVAPPNANTANVEFSFDFEASARAHYGSFSHSTSSKEICKEGTSQLQLEMNHIGNHSSSGVS